MLLLALSPLGYAAEASASAAALPQCMDRNVPEAYAEVITTLLAQEVIQKKIEQVPEYLTRAFGNACSSLHGGGGPWVARTNKTKKVLDALFAGTKTPAAVDAAFADLVTYSDDVWQLFADNGVTPYGYDKALLQAVKYGNEEATDWLIFILEKGKPTQAGKDKALELAREKESWKEKAELLIKHGAKAP